MASFSPFSSSVLVYLIIDEFLILWGSFHIPELSYMK